MTIEIVALVGLDLVSEEKVEGVVAEVRRPGEELVGVESRVAVHFLISAASNCSGVTAYGGHISDVLCVEYVISDVGAKDEVFCNVEVDVSSGTEVVASGLVERGLQLAIGIARRSNLAAGSVTPVVEDLAIGSVDLLAGVDVVQVERIDRRHGLGYPGEVGVVGTLAVVVLVHHGVGIGDVETGLDELADGVIHLAAYGDT